MRWIALVVGLSTLGIGSARAEQGEASGGVEGALVLPGFSSQDRTAFALATWGVGAVGQYGVLDDLYVQGRFSFMTFQGRSARDLEVSGRALPGTLEFETFQYHVELGARYKLLAGYDIAPYVETHLGYLWSAVRDQRFLTPGGKDYGVDLPNRGEGAFTLGGGVAVDYRLFDLLFVGVAVRFVYAFGGDFHRYHLATPLQVSVYW